MTLRRLSLTILPLLLTVFGVAPARADTVNYSFSAFGSTATFSLPSNPTPSLVGSDYFQIDNVSVAISGIGTYTGDIDFFTTAAGGGAGSGVNVLNGPQLFSGSLSDPTLLAGMFSLSGTVTPDSDGPVSISGTLDAATTGSTSVIPEPSSLLLLLTGVGSIGATVFRRKLHKP